MMRPIIAACALILVAGLPARSADQIDAITFGNPESEAGHHFKEQRAETVVGGLGEPARRILPSVAQNWEGGRLDFVLEVDPVKTNYATVRLWGSDVTTDCLTLFCDGKQIGYRHLGDVDLLDIGGDAPGCAGRFYYATCPLPLALTQGKRQLDFEIRASGGMWPYGGTFATFQHAMKEPSRGIYRLAITTDGYFSPPTEERQGRRPADPPVRKSPGLEQLRILALRVNGELRKLLASPRPLTQMQNQFLARAWLEPYTAAYHNPKALEQALTSLDATYAAYLKNPHLAASDPATPNAEWFGLGPSGDVLRLLASQWRAELDRTIPDGQGSRITRRAAYAQMLVDCRDWHRRHRRLYSNQTMINDLYGIYLANRGIEAVDPSRALSEPEVRRYLYESVGLEPWRNSDPGAADGPPETGGKRWPVAKDYWEITKKGLTKELGYVGYYGEVLDWVTTIYNATRPTPQAAGDERIRQQLIRLEKARAVFRYPDVDNDGNRAMRLEAIVGWRDPGHYPGDVGYGERATRDASAVYAPASTGDPAGIGYAQQMLADNQFFALLRDQMVDHGFRVTAGLLEVPTDYQRVATAEPSAVRLPMSPGQPDFIFSDEEDGVLAMKDGDRILYISLYWRAPRAVNFLARVHEITPQFDRIAVVKEAAVVDPSGLTYQRPDNAIVPYAGGIRYPEQIHSALAGEKLPIAPIPSQVDFKPGEESVYAGKAAFYSLRYGPYLIGMNLDARRTFPLNAPDGPRAVAPQTTVVVKVGK